jgi:hypothetical protein
MSTLKYTTDAGCHSPRQTLAGALVRHVTKPDKSPASRASHPGQDGVCALCEQKTKRRRPFHPRTPNGQGMVAGIAIQALENGWLNCSRSSLAKIESGLITVRDRDLPHFLNVFATSSEALNRAQVFRR